MGVLTDYFIAHDDAEAARALAELGGPSSLGLRTLELKGIDPVVNLAVLNEIVTGQNALGWIEANAATPPVAGDDEDGPWVIRVHPDHSTMLADLPADLDRIARRWAESEELAGADPAELAAILGDLRDLAREARTARQRLYCWWSL